MSFAKKSFSVFTTSVALFFLNTITSIIVSRILGPVNRGAFTIIFLVPSFLMMFSNLGLNVSNIYFIGKRKDKLEHIVSNSLVLSLVLGITFILIFAFLFPFLYPLFFKSIKPYFFFIAVSTLPITLFNSYCGSILLANDKVKQVNLLSLITAISYFVFLTISLLLTKHYLAGVTISQILATLVTLGMAIFWLKKITAIKFRFYPGLARKFVKFGIKGYSANFMTYLSYRLDMFLVAYFLNTEAVGYYGLAVGLAEMLWYIPNSINTILYPKVSGLSNRDANDFTPKVCRNTLFLIGMASLGTLFFGKFIIKFAYGAVYLPALKPLLIILPGIVILSIGKILSSYTTGQGRPIIATYSSGTTLIVNVLLNLIFIPKWGIAGAAFASTVAYSLSAGVILIAFLKISGNGLRQTLLIKKDDFGIYKTILLKLFTRVILGREKLKTTISQNI